MARQDTVTRFPPAIYRKTGAVPFFNSERKKNQYMFNFLKNVSRRRNARRMIKVNSHFILVELTNIVRDTITNLEINGRIKTPLHKEVLKFESTALVFWLFRGSSIFPEITHKLILDEIHSQYYTRLKKHGYDSNAVRSVCEDLNVRYKAYDQFTDDADDFVKVGTSFGKYLGERSKTGMDAREIMIAGDLIERTTAKFKEFHEVVKS